jgi:hypothetical protein
MKLDHKVGIFIMMNLANSGRRKLPETKLKALFRPFIEIVPDLKMI